MPDLTIDLSSQARPGEDFALGKQAGGTGRDDGFAVGFAFPAQNRFGDFGAAAISRGAVIERITGDNLGPSVTIKATNAATDKPIGIALEDIALGAQGAIAQAGAPVFVLTTGTVAVGDTLWTSGTAGRATATQTAGAYAIGISLNTASGTSSVWAIVTLLGAASGDHGFLTGLADDDHPQYATNAEFDDHNARHEPGGADPMAVDAAAATGSLRTLGSGATQAAAGPHAHAAGSTPVLVDETDGSPSVAANTLRFPVGTLTDLGSGDVYISAQAHIHIVGEQWAGDGSTTIFTLLNEAEPETVAAYNAGSRTVVTLGGGMNDQITFAVAPSNGVVILVDYIAATA